MTVELIPSILVDSQGEFERRLRLIEDDVETVHVDILDGTLFPQTTWFDADAVAAMRTRVKVELHLMVENPLPIVERWAQAVAGTHRAIVHAEIKRPLGAVLAQIKDTHGLETGLALNPETPLRAVKEHLHTVDQLTVMGVHPGSSGQAFLGESVLEKIQSARERHPDLPIEIDGGVTAALLPSLVSAGCTRLCAASMVFSAENPVEAIKSARKFLSTRA